MEYLHITTQLTSGVVDYCSCFMAFISEMSHVIDAKQLFMRLSLP